MITHLKQTPVHAGVMELIDKAKELSIKAKDKAKHEFMEHIDGVAKELKLTRDQVKLAFDEPKPLNILKACGYSFATLHGAFQAAHNVASHGVISALIHIAGHKTMHKIGHHIKDKAKDADAVIEKYPALKALTGPAIAGFMLYGYTTAQTSSLKDWDLANIGKALKGEISVAEFVQSSEAHALGTHIATGHGFTLASLAGSSVNLAVGLVATAIHHSDNPKMREWGNSIKEHVERLLPTKKLAVQEAPEKPEPAPKEKVEEKPAEVPVVDKPKEKKPETKAPPKEKPKKPDPAVPPAKPHDKSKSIKKSNPGWWDRMSDGSKEQYLKRHPESQMASTVSALIARAK